MRFVRAILAEIVVLAGWLIIFAGLAVSCAKMFGPVFMLELWSDSATWWMFPASALLVTVGVLVIWLGNRLREQKDRRQT